MSDNMNNEKKSEGQLLSERLFKKEQCAFDVMDEAQREDCEALCGDYKQFLNVSRTERLCAGWAEEELKRAGFAPLDAGELNAGGRFYVIHRGKAAVAGILGKEDISKGINVVVAHIDSPRIDLKPNPLYEDEGMALFKTHYYGGIKKYQWTAIPLSLHGVVVKGDGAKIEVSVGDGEDDPVFCVTDLLPHLAADQMSKKLSEGITGEGLNILVGSEPYPDREAQNRVKLNIMRLLNEKYGMTEEDFYSSELCLVPSFKARDIGFDRSLIGSYGHDDRVCGYAALRALTGLEGAPERTCICVLADKEEIGSMGNTGMQSRFFENVVAELCERYGAKTREVLDRSTCLSADVNVAFDPNFPEVSEKRNTARAGGGVALTKYTGARGKSGSSDASAELLGSIRRLFNDNGVLWQFGELGKVDQGGGGTVAQYMANMGMDTVDCGVPVLSMHSPFEVISKNDLYMMTQAFGVFYDKFCG